MPAAVSRTTPAGSGSETVTALAASDGARIWTAPLAGGGLPPVSLRRAAVLQAQVRDELLGRLDDAEEDDMVT